MSCTNSTQKGRQIYATWLGTARLGGSDRRSFTTRPHGSYERYDSDIALSPDGSQVAFVRETEGGNALFVLSTDGGAIRRLVGAAQIGRSVVGPIWSPDGTTIAFAGGDCTYSPRLYTISADGTQLRRLPPLPVAHNLRWIEPYGWSPDGSELLYDVQDWIDDCFKASEFDRADLYTVSADGTSPSRLPGVRFGPYLVNAAWSPSGSSIVTTTYDPNSQTCSLVMIAPGSSSLRTLARGCGGRGGFVWDPSGNSVIVARDSSIDRIDVRTGQRSIIMHTHPYHCCWISTDGQLIAFAPSRGDVIGNAVVAVTPGGVAVARLTSPRGTLINSLDVDLG